MKSLLFLLPLLGAFVLADEKCQCPQVKCPADDPVKLCQCVNSREMKCKERCPKYTPTYLPCPASPTAAPSPPQPSCTCDSEHCLTIWPGSCYCLNDVAKRCFEKCGGPEPSYQSCPPQTAAPTFTTSTKKTPPAPAPTNPICGGGRGNYKSCAEGYICINDPTKPGCGPECDGLGICVKEKMCGGFAGFACEVESMICVDDPRDDCDPKEGGADCGGVCMFKTT